MLIWPNSCTIPYACFWFCVQIWSLRCYECKCLNSLCSLLRLFTWKQLLTLCSFHYWRTLPILALRLLLNISAHYSNAKLKIQMLPSSPCSLTQSAKCVSQRTTEAPNRSRSSVCAHICESPWTWRSKATHTVRKENEFLLHEAYFGMLMRFLIVSNLSIVWMRSARLTGWSWSPKIRSFSHCLCDLGGMQHRKNSTSCLLPIIWDTSDTLNGRAWLEVWDQDSLTCLFPLETTIDSIWAVSMAYSLATVMRCLYLDRSAFQNRYSIHR